MTIASGEFWRLMKDMLEALIARALIISNNPDFGGFWLWNPKKLFKNSGMNFRGTTLFSDAGGQIRNL